MKPAIDLQREDFDYVYGTNVFGVFNTARAIAKLWIERKTQGGSSFFTCRDRSDNCVNAYFDFDTEFLCDFGRNFLCVLRAPVRSLA